MRLACISDDTNASMLATSGPDSGATPAAPCRLCAAATGSTVNRSASNGRREQKTPLAALRYKLVILIHSLFFSPATRDWLTYKKLTYRVIQVFYFSM
jgi:hypothetical protein